MSEKLFGNSSVDFLRMLNDLEFDQKSKHYAVKKIMAIGISTSYYVAEEIRPGTTPNS